MRSIGLGTVLISLTLTAVAVVSALAAPAEQLALTDDNTLVRFDANHPSETEQVKVSGISGTLLGIDYRPANGLLYGVTNANNIYTLDPATGVATLVCTLTVAFDGDLRSGVDFNPQSDRLRLVASTGQNLRVHADIGAAATDGALTYAATDQHFGTKPHIVAVAYTNSVAGAPSTQTFDIDADLDVLVLQEPPNDGILVTVGPLGVDFGPLGGFDILTDGTGTNSAFAVSGATLYGIDLATGAATPLGTIGKGSFNLIGLAAVRSVAIAFPSS
jgi:Domain of unknown function (DUF4394)